MNNENPIYRAWAKAKGQLTLPTMNSPVVLVKELIHGNHLGPEKIGAELFDECLDEILWGGCDSYPREILSWAIEQKGSAQTPAGVI